MTLLLLFACSGDDPGPTTAPTGATGDTAPYEGPCARTNNALRFVCDVPGGGTLRWWPVDDPTDVREAMGDEVVVWGLRPDVDTVLAWPDGTEERLVPGALPVDFAGVDRIVEGEGLGTWVLTVSPCNNRHLMALDGQGRVRWYQEHERRVLGFDVTPTGTVLAMFGGGGFLEYDPTGAVVWETANETGNPIHHDLARDEAGYTYALAATTYEVRDVSYIVDQLLVFAPDGSLHTTWELFDHLPDLYTPTDNNGYWTVQFPGAIDFTHGNSVEVAPDGTLILSLRWLDAVLAIEGDPTDPAFGTPRWWLSADGSIPPDQTAEDDLTLVGETFDGQHHATVDADGVLRLFDNRAMPQESRALAFRIDGTTATHEQTWVMDKHCPIQGSIYVLDDGDVVLTCATTRRIERFASDGPAVGAADLACGSGAGGVIPRAIPMDW